MQLRVGANESNFGLSPRAREAMARAVDQVRRAENKLLKKAADERLIPLPVAARSLKVPLWMPVKSYRTATVSPSPTICIMLKRAPSKAA